MAVTNCDELSNIISLGIITGDDDLANEIAMLSATKKDALMRSKKIEGEDGVDEILGLSVNELELKASSADIKLRAIVQAKILTDDVRVADAYRELASQIKKSGGTIASGVDLLEKLRNAPTTDLEEIAKQWGGEYAKEPAKAIKEMREAIAATISANYSIRQYSDFTSGGIMSLKKQLRENEITKEEFNKKVGSLHKEAMEQIAKGENPKNFVKLDAEWNSIKKTFGGNPLEAGEAWTQFIMARELLSDGAIDDEILEAFAKLGGKDLAGELTIDWISKCGKDDLDVLLAKAYTNTKQLYTDGNLREVYRQKLIELTSGMNVSKENISKATSILNTIQFAEQGATFSHIVLADNAKRSAQRLGLKIEDGTKFVDGIKSFCKKLIDDPSVLDGPIKISGVEMSSLDLIQIIYDITGDENIIKLLNLGFFSDGAVLSVATARLLGGTKEASDKLLKLFSKAKQVAKVSNTRDVSLKAICGTEIKENAPIGYFDYKTSLYDKNELNRTKADFMDKLADKNKMKVPGDGVSVITTTDDISRLENSLKDYKGGYIVVRDAQWRNNDVLSNAIDNVNKDLADDEKITLLFPRGGMTSSFVMEDGQLYFKTLDDNTFNNVAGIISIQTLMESRPTREILATAYEAANGDVNAMIKYNDELNQVTSRYFGEMLGISTPDTITPEYINNVQQTLSDMLGIDLNVFTEIKDKSALWQKIDKQFSLEKLTTGKYDKQIVDINDIKNQISKYTDDKLEENIKNDLGDLMITGSVKGNQNIEHIREAYLDYKTAGTVVDSLAAKGKIVSLANGGTAESMSMQDIIDMFSNGTFNQKYKEIFFPNQQLTDNELSKFSKAINNDIFDALSIVFADNLVKAGYSLPLMNIKEFVYDYLHGKLDLNNKFVESFLYKNGIPFTQDGLRGIVNSLMPTDFKFNYEDSLFKGRFNKLEKGKASVVFETNNIFLGDSYSALASIEGARAGETITNHEKEILYSILDKYVNAVTEGVRNGTLKFRDAQKLKQEAGYALDMFEQDFLIPRYGKFLTRGERQGLVGMKYSLPIGVAGQNPENVFTELNSIRNKLLDKYDIIIGGAAKNNDINMAVLKGAEGTDANMKKRIEERRQQLIENGGVIKDINGTYVVYNVKQALSETINNLPENIGGLGGLKELGASGIEQMTNKQAYAVLRYLEAAKGLNTTLNYVTSIMYKVNPKLAKCNFFENYKVGKSGLPKALEGNILEADKFLYQFDNVGQFDNIAKKSIFGKIINTFKNRGYITTDTLSKIVAEGVEETQSTIKLLNLSPIDTKNAMDRMRLVYVKVFEPYTYVRDIPKGGKLIDGKTTIKNVKARVKETIKQQYTQAVEDLKAAGIGDLDSIQNSIYIELNNGEKITLNNAGAMDIDSWKKDIFNDKSVFVAGADEIKSFNGGPDDERLLKEQKEHRNGIVSQYDSALSSLLSQTQFISDSERKLNTAFWNYIRQTMRGYTLTNKIVDALDAVTGLNEEAARGIKDYLIGWKGNLTFGTWKPNQILDRAELVKDAYKTFYYMDISKLNKVVPNSKAEDLALRLAKYFKTLERLLGSVDGATGCTTKASLNRAFYHIGEVVMNVDTVKGIFGLLSGIEQNQILKFFKFSKGELRKNADVFIRAGKGEFNENLGGYRDYAEKISGITHDDFNDIFATNFSENEFSRVLQGLTGFSLVGAWGKKGMQILNFLNGSNFVFRALMSYPGQLLTIPQQTLAYFLKQMGFEKEQGIESLSEIDAVRQQTGILDGAFNELFNIGKSTVSPDDIRLDSNFNRYGLPDVDEVYKSISVESSDDYLNMYAKINNYGASSISATDKIIRALDPYKDNANNFIDGIFARNFKNISFQKAIKGNDFLQFTSAKEFLNFMEDTTVPADVKTKLMDRVAAYSGRNFRNILGLGFGGIDRAVGGNGFWNIIHGITQLFNFRGSWGQNIFKQTGAAIITAVKMLSLSKGGISREGKEMIAEYIAKTPEFSNFVSALFNDLKWTWKLQRFQDNGRFPEDDDMYDALDFIEYITETLNMTSQWYQGLQSYGPMRPVLEAWGINGSMWNSNMNPTIYKDTFGVGAFFNALGKNFGRQWKPYNWIAKLIGAWVTNGPEGAKDYVQNERWKLSFGSLRYMVNEDMNGYGYTYEMAGQEGGIPSILMGESKLGSDKNFVYELDNTETWETIKQAFDRDNPWDTRKVYVGNLWKTMVNGSQLLSLPKNLFRLKRAPGYSTPSDLADTIQSTEAGKEFYSRGVVTPTTPEEAKKFFDIMLANSQYRPGSSSFTKSIMQFDAYGHMAGEKGTEDDDDMELWLNHMKYLTNEHGEYEMDGGEKIVDPSWNMLMQEIQNKGYDSTYVTSLIYNYSKAWLNNHSSDPNYQLYVKMLGQGQAHLLVEKQLDDIVAALNVGQTGKDNKWTESEFKAVGNYNQMLLDLGNSVLEGDDVTFFEKLQRLDEDDSTVAALAIIQSQAKGEDRKMLDKFFDVTEKDDGTQSVKLKYNYEKVLMQVGAMAKAIDSGDVELALAEASTLVNMYSNSDPTGAITASIIDSVYNRVYDTDSFTPSQKQDIMIALFHKNKDFIQKNPEELREYLGDDYDVFADYMNQMLYQWDSMTISNLESIQTGGNGSSGKSSAAGSFSSALKKLATSYGGSGGSSRGTGSVGSYKDWVPVVIEGANLVKDLGLKGYTPTSVDIKLNPYKPHTDLSINKDIKRKVKPKTTTAVSSSKQISKIEEKTQKAIEAE